MEGKSGLSGKAVFLINAFSGAFLVSRTVKNLPTMLETMVQSVVRKMPWRKEWLPIPVFLPGEFHGQRRLAGHNSQARKESDTTERLTLLLPATFPGGSNSKESACSAGDPGSIPGSGRLPGEGNGNPLQYSCLGSLMNSWQATFHGVARVRHNLVTQPTPCIHIPPSWTSLPPFFHPTHLDHH